MRLLIQKVEGGAQELAVSKRLCSFHCDLLCYGYIVLGYLIYLLVVVGLVSMAVNEALLRKLTFELNGEE